MCFAQLGRQLADYFRWFIAQCCRLETSENGDVEMHEIQQNPYSIERIVGEPQPIMVMALPSSSQAVVDVRHATSNPDGTRFYRHERGEKVSEKIGALLLQIRFMLFSCYAMT